MNRIIQKSLQMFLITVAVMAALFLCPGNAFAADSGTCGDGLTWTLSDDGKLVFSGSGTLEGINWNEQNVLEVSIPAGVTSIEEGLFLGCSNLNNINVSPSNNHFASVNGVLLSKDKTALVEFPAGRSGAYTIPGTVRTILIGAFARCGKITSITMPDSVTTLGKYAFNCCEKLTKVVISKNVKVIPGECFSSCPALTSVTIPEGVKKIESSAFWGCSSLTKVTIPRSIDQGGISDDAFARCPLDEDSLEAVNKKVKAALEAAFELKAGESKDYELSPIVKGSLFEGAFFAESSDTSVVRIVTIARTGSVVYSNAVKYFFDLCVRAIGPGKTVVTVYANKTKKNVITKITFTVPGDASGKTGAKTVTYGSGIYKLSGSGAVLIKPKNKNITKLTIPAAVSANGKKYKVTSVSAKACKGLKKLKTLTIGKNVKSIGKNAFQGCSKLTTITIKTTKLTKKNVGAKAFSGTPAKATVKVPKRVRKAYKKWLLSKGISKKAKIK